MMELVMAMAKAMSEKEIIENLEKDLNAYKEHPGDQKAKSRLHFSCMLLTLRNSTDKMSMHEAIQMVEDMKKKHELFNIKDKVN